MLRRMTHPSVLLLWLALSLVPRGGGAREPAAGPAPSGAPPDSRIKVVSKPVPCVPCPCECPDLRGAALVSSPPPQGQGQGAGTAVASGLSSSNLGNTTGNGAGDERGDHGARVRPVEEPPRPAPLPPPARGIVSGSVIVHDRGGKEKADNSDVVVYIERMPRRYAALKHERIMAQRDKTFAPHILAVTKGSAVEFPNEDKFFHNVFSLSEGNAFDLGLYRAGTSRSVTFEKSGVVDVYCNIHPNMWGQILVLDNPFYGVTTKEGTFEIPKVPPGNYLLVAWLSGGEPVRQPVKVEPGGRALVKFDLREGSSSKPHLNKFNQPYGRYK